MKVFQIYDLKAEAYLEPIYTETTGLAIRRFQATTNNPKSVFCEYPEDFTLYETGEWDSRTGRHTEHENPIPLGKANEFKTQNQGVNNNE